jgi:hypothetical protein
MSCKRLIFTLLVFLIIVTTSYANNDIKISFLKTNNYNELQIKKVIESSDSLDILLNTLNNEFKFKKKITIEIGENKGPLYDSETNKILIPYRFYQETYDTFKNVDYEKTGLSIEEATIDVLIQTILHELAHALIEIHKLTIVGNEENVADSFAAVILIEFFENGEEILFSSSDIFKIYSDNHKLTQKDFMGEHPLDIQRFYDSLCYIYGSAPLKYKNLLEDLDYSEERKLLCKEDYIKNVNNWFILLQKYFNKSSG